LEEAVYEANLIGDAFHASKAVPVLIDKWRKSNPNNSEAQEFPTVTVQGYVSHEHELRTGRRCLRRLPGLKEEGGKLEPHVLERQIAIK